LLAATGVVGFAPVCLACSCVERSKQERFTEADVVFTGVVDRLDRGEITQATFDVTSVEKGGAAPEQVIRTVNDEAGCGVTFVEGDRYQVFATQEDDGNLHTTICAGTVSLDAKQKPYISTEGAVPSTPKPEETLSPREALEQGPMGTMLREQRQAQEATKARRNYTFAGVALVVIALAIGLLLRRRRQKMRSAV
jgi:hypothetical protein